MRFLGLLAALILLFGCISFGERGNESTVPPSPNVTMNESNNSNVTTPPPPPPSNPYKRYNATGFSFEYPADMAFQDSATGKSGIFSAKHETGGQTYEVMILTYMDTIAAYGVNKDEIFRDNPSKAASDILEMDKVSDSAGVLDRASEIGDTTVFSIDRGTYGARAPFKIKVGDGNRTFSGYALSIYVPERSLHVKVRIFAVDPDKAEDIMQNFLLTFRLE